MAPDLLQSFYATVLYDANPYFVHIPENIPDFPCTIEDPLFLACWDVVQPWTMASIYKAKQIWDLAIEAKDLEGDFIECGCHLGGMSFLLALLIQHFKLKKKIYLLDSFQGLPAPDPVRDAIFVEGTLVSDLDKCRSFIHDHQLTAIAIVKPGWFADTLPTFAKDHQFALCHFDGDLFASMVTCFQALYTKTVDRGVIILDDYNFPSPGVRLATQQYLADTKESIECGPLPHAYFRKGCNTLDPTQAIPDHEGHLISCKELSQNRPYRDFLVHIAEHYHAQAENLAALANLIK